MICESAKCVLRFDPNGGTGVPEDVHATARLYGGKGIAEFVIPRSFPRREGYDFKGYSVPRIDSDGNADRVLAYLFKGSGFKTKVRCSESEREFVAKALWEPVEGSAYPYRTEKRRAKVLRLDAWCERVAARRPKQASTPRPRPRRPRPCGSIPSPCRGRGRRRRP